MSFSARTDLAVEHEALHTEQHDPGFLHRQKTSDGIETDTVEIVNERGAQALGRPIGRYTTLSFDELSPDRLGKRIRDELRALIGRHAERILTVGLGNRDITADAIGPMTVERLAVTGHLACSQRIKHYAIAPSVLGKTGIESLALIKAAKEAANADVVVCVDALAAKSISRLYKTVQLGNSGIVPGSGVGNHRHAIAEETLGIPVIAVGVPTVVASSTLVHDTLKTALDVLPEELEETLLRIDPFFVTPPDADLETEALASAIAHAINTL